MDRIGQRIGSISSVRLISLGKRKVSVRPHAGRENRAVSCSAKQGTRPSAANAEAKGSQQVASPDECPPKKYRGASPRSTGGGLLEAGRTLTCLGEYQACPDDCLCGYLESLAGSTCLYVPRMHETRGIGRLPSAANVSCGRDASLHVVQPDARLPTCSRCTSCRTRCSRADATPNLTCTSLPSHVTRIEIEQCASARSA